MNIFLKAKHWQLFLLIFGIPMIIQFIMMGTMMSRFNTEIDSSPTLMFNYMKIFPIIMIFFIAVLFGWFWAVAIGLQKKVPETIKMAVVRFKVFFFTPLIYISVFTVLFMINWTVDGPNPIVFAGMVPLHLFSMFCMFYCLYFVSKTFKTVELQREVKFSDFAGEFMLVWFYPIGIWIIQPKINKMIQG